MSGVEIGLARVEDAARCPAIEESAALQFSAEDLPPDLAASTTGIETFARAVREDRLLVARDPQTGEAVGFALLEIDDGEAHLEELDVLPAYGRRGIGRALLEAACAWALERDHGAITLSTFAHVPWNAPFYASAGFEVVPRAAWSEAMVERSAEEAAEGLDPGRRVMMRRVLCG